MKTSRIFWGYLGRFTLVHLLTYVIFGITFMLISDYAGIFKSPAMVGFMRPVDDPIVALGVPMQIFRGALLGLALYPFRPVLVEGRWGFLKLWGVLWVLTGIGAVITGPGSLEGIVYTTIGWQNPLVGYPEITFQMLAFSWLFVTWERRVEHKHQMDAAVLKVAGQPG